MTWPTYTIEQGIPPPEAPSGITAALRSLAVGESFEHGVRSGGLTTITARLKPKRFTTHKQRDGVYRTWRIADADI